jgi:hypothetical protein
MRLLSTSKPSLRSSSLTISYHAICVSTHIMLFYIVRLFREENKKRLMNDVHANKYSYLT